MAFVNDPTEEELQRALAQLGPSSSVQSGPGAASAGGGGAGATAVPAGPAPGSAPGGDPQGTGFVNLSRYFDANTAGAGKAAAGLMDPLKVDLGQVGASAAAAAPLPTAPTPAPYEMTPTSTPAADDSGAIQLGYMSGDNWVPAVSTPINPEATDAANAAQASDYEKAIADIQAKAAAEARSKATTEALGKGMTLAGDPLKRAEAMSTDGKNPSAFDSYLAGAAMPDAFKDLRTYYTSATPPIGDPARPTGPGAPSASGAPGAYPMASAATALDPQKRKRSNAGGW